MKNNSFPLKLAAYIYNEQQKRPLMELHNHASMELYYLISGEVDICYINPKTEALEQIKMFPNTFVLIQPYIMHSINSIRPVKYTVIEISLYNESNDLINYLKQSEYVRQFDSTTNLLTDWLDVLLLKDTQNMLELLRKFSCFFDNAPQEPFYAAQLEIRLKQLFLAIIQCAAEEKSPSGYIIHVKRILSFLQSSYDKNITIKNIAEHTNLSPSHLQRIFKEHLGKSVIEKLNEIRITKACRLLLDSNYSVKTIAQLTGFNSLQAFKYNFKKINGKTPYEYKQTELLKKVRFRNR